MCLGLNFKYMNIKTNYYEILFDGYSTYDIQIYL